MSISICCPECGETIGIEPERNTVNRAAAGVDYSDSLYTCHLVCPGKGLHPAPIRHEYFVYKQWVKRISIYFPETETDSTYFQYVGPKTKFALWRSRFFGPLHEEDFLVDGEIVKYGSDGRHHGAALVAFK